MTKSEAMQHDAVLNYKKNGGNMEQAMLDAGYAPSTAKKQQRRLLKKVGVQIEEVQKEMDAPKIKTIQEVQEWWSDQIGNPTVEKKDQIKCSELLVKSQGGFVDKMQVDTKINTGQLDNVLKQLRGDSGG